MRADSNLKLTSFDRMWTESDSLFIISICIFATMVGEVYSHDLESPCPGIFSYHYDRRKTLYGEILIKRVPSNILQVNVELSVGNEVWKDNTGDIELSKPKDQVHQDILDSKPIVYKVYFPRWTTNPPRITKISVDGELICSGPPIPERSASTIGTISISHTLTVSSRRPQLSFNTPEDSSFYNEEDWPHPGQYGGGAENTMQQEEAISSLLENIFSRNKLVSPADPAMIYSMNPFFGEQSAKVRGRPVEEVSSWSQTSSNAPKNSISKEEDSPPPDRYGRGAEKTVQYEEPLSSFLEKVFRVPSSTPTVAYSKNPFLGTQSEEKPTIIFRQKQELSFKIDPDKSREEVPKEKVKDPHLASHWNEDVSPVGREPNISPHQSSLGDVCGRPTATMFRIIEGQAALQAAYPWLAALYLSRSIGYLYQCGGSLVSDRLVITAAHCVSENVENPEKLLIVLGQWNLQTLGVRHNDTKMMAPAHVIVHPEYDSKSSSANADIAILVLPEAVPFSIHVRPLCLWTENSDLSKVVGMDGMVVGWGTGANGVLRTDEPTQIKLPIVSQEGCLRSHERYYHLTSFNTFCAGFRNGSGPCIGDSGSGFIMKRNGKWSLRGVVSRSLEDKITKCDLSNYVVFTDASKYSDWLIGFMKKY